MLLIAGAVLAGVVQGITGFAFGMVAMSVWVWGIDPAEAAVLAVFGGLCGQILSALTIRRRAAVADLLPFLIGGLLGVPVGTYLLPYISAFQFRIFLGLVLALGCPLMLITPRFRIADVAGRAGDGVAGIVGGVMGGISGLTGIAPAIWCSLRGYEKSRQRELIQNFNLAILAVTMAMLIGKGAVTGAMVPHLGIVGFAMLVPSIIGAKIYNRLSDYSFRRVVLVVLTLSGIALLASTLYA
jgi:uncharacterized protein